jgi:uncharacterized protein
MRRSLRGAGPALALFVLAVVFAAADIQIPPAPSQWVTDTAGFLSPQAVESLNAELRALDETSGQQVLVYIGKTTAGVPVEDYAVKAFEAWKPGRKGLDNGLILFIFAEDRKIRIEVGYGLEEKVTDAISGRIINEVLTPRIQAGDRDGAVRGAVALIKQALGAEATGGEPSTLRGRHSPLESALAVIGIIVFLIIFITHPSFALWLLFNILGGGGRGGGGGFGGGGFSGGGGRSGGGGASGGW